MNVQHIKAFVLANQLGSISAAARAMGKRQSQVSQWISDLEVDFGVTLFERTGNSTRLSEDGETLLPLMIHTLSQAEKLSACATALSRDEPVTLRLGIDNYIPQSCLQASLVSILTELTVNIEVSTDDRKHLLQQLQNETLDIALLSEHSTLHYSNYEYCRLGSYRDVLVAGHQHLLCQESMVSTEHLSEQRELIWTREDITEDIAEDSDGGYSASYATFSELSTLVALLKSGLGYAFLPEDMIKTELANQTLTLLNTDFEQTQIARRVELVWQPGLTLTQQGGKLIQTLKARHGFIR